MWQEFSQDLFRRLEFFLYEWKINSHFDIACGTGDFVYLMKKIGINSSGSDISKKMVQGARNNYPGIKFGIADMRNFKLKDKVDLITCNFDSINHLLKFSEWEETFLHVFNNLDINGKFLFDFNTIHLITSHKERSEVVIDNSKMDINIYPEKKNILVFDIVSTQTKGSQKKIISEKVRETSFEYSEIKRTLLGLGFSKVDIFNSKLGFSSSKKRKYILATK
ncbi:MAG: class I SAM-dependent methyltransferase [Patescibacteria group bacterium]|nr:class I SAM-dependent methyltransferase [Patescibacteria group bacterium]